MDDTIIKKLNSLKEYYTLLNDKYRVIAYSKAINVYTTTGIISDRILTNVNNYNETTIKSIMTNYKDIITVIGFGHASALDYAKKGHSVKDLIEMYNKGVRFTSAQKIGLEYYDKLVTRIARTEIDTLLSRRVKGTSLMSTLNKFNGTVVGSYRRHKPIVSDIDILLAFKNNDTIKLFLEKVKEHFNVVTIAQGGSKFMGIIDLFGRQLRIDVRSVTKEQYPFALLYFTGSKQFNTTIRLHAKKMGYKLNEYNLGNFKGDKIRTEKDIFKALKIKYLKPEER